MATTITEMIKGNKSVTLVRFDGHTKSLWYTTECGFEFPVPLADTDGAIFLAKDKATFFLRWLRPHFGLVQKAKLDELMLSK